MDIVDIVRIWSCFCFTLKRQQSKDKCAILYTWRGLRHIDFVRYSKWVLLTSWSCQCPPSVSNQQCWWSGIQCCQYSLTSLTRHSFIRHPWYYDTFLRDQTSYFTTPSVISLWHSVIATFRIFVLSYWRG